jgi:hypothetical protein
MALAIALLALVVLGGLAALVILKGRDADEAAGVLSSETRKRDQASIVLGDEAELTGKQVRGHRSSNARLRRRNWYSLPGRRPHRRLTYRRILRSSVSVVASSSTARSSS